MDRENLLDELQDLKTEIEEIFEDIKRCDYLAGKTKDTKELAEISKQLKSLNATLREDKKEMAKILKQLEKM